MKRIYLMCAGTLLPFVSGSAMAADDTVTLNLNTVWVVTAAVLVFFMQAGFALLESGSTRAKNSINVMMKNFIDVCLATLVFWTVGYGLMFGTNSTGWFGTSQFMLNQAGESDYTMLLFQSMFAATAATIVSGAIAERTKFTSYIVCAVLLCAFIYPVYGSWVWNSGGWLAEKGFVDFAGSTVVHSIGGWCALAAAIVIGPRLGRFDRETGEPREIPGHNLSLVALGGFILWLGWFGFNAGSTLEASQSIGLIALNTHLAACAGALGTLVFSILFRQPHSVNLLREWRAFGPGGYHRRLRLDGPTIRCAHWLYSRHHVLTRCPVTAEIQNRRRSGCHSRTWHWWCLGHRSGGHFLSR